MYLVRISDEQFVNPQNVASIWGESEDPNVSRIIFTDGRTQRQVSMPPRELADVLNGEALRYVITQTEDGDWWCECPGDTLSMGYGASPEEALSDAKAKWAIRNEPEVVVDPLPVEETTPEEPTEPSQN